MKHVIAASVALAACEFAGPPVAGVMGMKATAGFDGADVVCILTGLAFFFLSLFIASFF